MGNFSHGKNKCWVCEGHVLSWIFWSRKYAFCLKPLFTTGKETEKIKYELEKLPAGMIETTLREKKEKEMSMKKQ